MFGNKKLFEDYVCQKHVVPEQKGVIDKITYTLPDSFSLFEYRKKGDLLHDNLSSARARVADVCFKAESLEDAIIKSQTIDHAAVINVNA